MKIGSMIFTFAAVFGTLIGLSVLMGCFYTVGSNERGVLFRYGAVVRVVEPGLGFKTPWIEGVTKYSTNWHTLTWDKIQGYSKDQQPADLKVSVNWQLQADQVSCMPISYGYETALESGLVAPKVQNAVKNVFGTYTAQEAINKRKNLTDDMAAAIEAAVGAVQPCGKTIVQVNNFNLEDVEFSDAYEKSIEERMIAEIQVAKAKQTADRAKAEADQAYNEADGRARSVEREAEASAKSIKLKGDAEAEVIIKKGNALKDNPGVAQLTIAQKWDGKLPTSMIPGSTVPFMAITPPQQ